MKKLSDEQLDEISERLVTNTSAVKHFPSVISDASANEMLQDIRDLLSHIDALNKELRETKAENQILLDALHAEIDSFRTQLEASKKSIELQIKRTDEAKEERDQLKADLDRATRNHAMMLITRDHYCEVFRKAEKESDRLRAENKVLRKSLIDILSEVGTSTLANKLATSAIAKADRLKDGKDES